MGSAGVQNGPLVKRHLLAADKLVVFMSLAGQQNDVARACLADCGANCIGTVGNDQIRTSVGRESGGDVGDHRFGGFKIGIVSRQNSQIAQLVGDSAQFRSAQLCTPADRPEQTDQPRRIVAAQRLQRRTQADAVVRVVDQKGDIGQHVDRFKAALDGNW